MSARPNILLIITDQLSARALPAYGDAYAQTPHIDRIVRRGVRFDRCTTNCPLCQPARAAWWTGRFPHSTGVLSNGRKHPVPPVPADMPTVGELFAGAGYETVHYGKTHDAGSLRGFRVDAQADLPVQAAPAWPINHDTLHDRHTTTQVVEYLNQRERGEQPFLLVADLNNPHNICGWVGENAGVHQDVPVSVPLPPLPDNFADGDLEQRPLPVQYICCSHNRLSQAGPWNEANYRHYLAAYYHYLSRVDAEIGLILDALEARPDGQNTLIVFTSDHGDGMAEHRMVTKQVSMYDNTTRVPLAFAGPGVSGRDRVVRQALTSNLDLLPTLCAWAEIDAPPGLWGRSLVPWLQAEREDSPHDYVVSEWHTEWGFTISPGRMVRSARYKYVRYLEGSERGLSEELYDMEADPGEKKTLVGDPAYASPLEAHRALLQAHVEATGDDFFDLAWTADPRWRSHKPGYQNHVGPAAPMVG